MHSVLPFLPVTFCEGVVLHLEAANSIVVVRCHGNESRLGEIEAPADLLHVGLHAYDVHSGTVFLHSVQEYLRTAKERENETYTETYEIMMMSSEVHVTVGIFEIAAGRQ